jgi:hypothetical protein
MLGFWAFVAMVYAYLAVFALEGSEETHYQERQEALSYLV